MRKEYQTIVTETVIIKTPKNTYVQAVFEKVAHQRPMTKHGHVLHFEQQNSFAEYVLQKFYE